MLESTGIAIRVKTEVKTGDILKRARIDINSEENIATINREAHWYLHTSLYHWSVAEYLGKAEKAGEGRVSAALATLKLELMAL